MTHQPSSITKHQPLIYHHPSFIIHHILPNHQSLFLVNHPSTIVHHLPMWWSIQLTLEPNNHHPSSIICYLSPITHHTTSQTPSNVTHKLSMINNQPSALINHIPASSSPISFHSSLSTFCHSPMTNQ